MRPGDEVLGMADCFAESLSREQKSAVRDTAALRRFQSASLEMKIAYTSAKMRAFLEYMDGKVYVSFSGGKDSTVLLDLARQVAPDMPAVFFDTGLEFPEIRAHVKSFGNVEIVKPKASFREVVTAYGYPVVSKNVSQKVWQARNGSEAALKLFSETKGRFAMYRYRYLLDAPFPISNKCCDIMKKAPAHDYWKRTGRAPIIGTRCEESQFRTDSWLHHGEMVLNCTPPRCNPMAIWTASDVDAYIERRGLKLADVYYMGYKRTGCMYCLYGAQGDGTPNRVQLLKKTHPAQWERMMKPLDEGGFGMGEVCDFLGIATGKDQQSLGGKEDDCDEAGDDA